MNAALDFNRAMVLLAAVVATAATLAMGVFGLPVLAIGVPLGLIGGIILLAQPVLGVMVLLLFSQLDSIEKLLFGFLPISAYKLLTGVTAAAAIITAARRREWIATTFRDPVVACAMLFGAIGVVSFLYAGERGVALAELRKNASLLALLLLIVALVDTRQKLGIMIGLLVASSLISALILMADTMLGTHLVAQSEAATTAESSEGFVRSSGASDQNPTTAASMLLVGVVAALVHLLESRRWRVVMLVAVGVGTMALIMSFARSAAVAYGLVVVALAWRFRKERIVPLALFGVLLAGLAALPFIPPQYWQRLGTLFGSGGDWTLGRRLSYNLIGLQLFAERPILGIGPGNFAERFTDPEFRFYPGRTLLGRELHNMYLSVLVQYGVLGGAAFFGMLGAALTAALRAARNPANEQMRVWSLALAFGFVGYLIASLFLPNEYTKYTWALSGLCAAMYRVNLQELERRP